MRLTDSMNPTTGAQIQTQFVQVERERERGGTQLHNGSTDGSTTDNSAMGDRMESIRETSEIMVEEVQRGCKPRNLDTESRIVGGVLFHWWMWMHRSPSELDEPSPNGWRRTR